MLTVSYVYLNYFMNVFFIRKVSSMTFTPSRVAFLPACQMICESSRLGTKAKNGHQNSVMSLI